MRRARILFAAAAILCAALAGDTGSAQRRRRPAHTEGRPPYHLAGGKLLETDTYQLYGQIYYDQTKWCLGEEGRRRASVTLIFDVDENYVITNDEAYRRRFETEILPALEKDCRPLAEVRLDHYFKNSKFVWVSPDVKEYAAGDPSYPGDERSFTTITARRDETGRFQFSKPEYASLAEFRQAGRAKQEERARQEEVFKQQQAERQKQLAAEAAAHERRLAAESKNGQEPHSEELALAIFRMMYPTCGEVRFNEACEPATGMTLKVVSATKYRCKPVAVGSDYHCAYNFKIECRGHLLLCPAMEADINSRTIKAGFRRAGSRWNLYVLTDEQRNAL